MGRPKHHQAGLALALVPRKHSLLAPLVANVFDGGPRTHVTLEVLTSQAASQVGSQAGRAEPIDLPA